MVMRDEILVLKTYVEISSYRLRAMKSIGYDTKIPTEIAAESGIRPNHISKVLKELKEHSLAICINEPMRKGRLYRLTDKGIEVLKNLDN